MRTFMLLGGALAASCATVATATIENRLVNLGLSEARAGCMADELDARLSDDDLTRLARHAVTLSAADDPAEVISGLAQIDDFGIATAVLGSGAACLRAVS